MCAEFEVGELLSAKVRRAFRYLEASRRPPSGSVLMRKARKMFPTFTLLGPCYGLSHVFSVDNLRCFECAVVVDFFSDVELPSDGRDLSWGGFVGGYGPEAWAVKYSGVDGSGGDR